MIAHNLHATRKIADRQKSTFTWKGCCLAGTDWLAWSSFQHFSGPLRSCSLPFPRTMDALQGDSQVGALVREWRMRCKCSHKALWNASVSDSQDWCQSSTPRFPTRWYRSKTPTRCDWLLYYAIYSERKKAWHPNRQCCTPIVHVRATSSQFTWISFSKWWHI